jgi:hypothetical protein
MAAESSRRREGRTLHNTDGCTEEDNMLIPSAGRRYQSAGLQKRVASREGREVANFFRDSLLICMTSHEKVNKSLASEIPCTRIERGLRFSLRDCAVEIITKFCSDDNATPRNVEMITLRDSKSSLLANDVADSVKYM